MAKRKAPAVAPKKSDVIREVLAAQPKATVKEIQAALDERKVEASVALINKIKYGRKPTGNKAGRRAGKVSKATAIRSMFDELGLEARPRDVIAALKGKGVVVTSAQVSTLRSKLSSNGHGTSRISASSVASSNVSLEHLLAAKTLAERLGGIENARQALNSLAKLIQG